MICTQPFITPLGGVTLTSDGEALTGLWFDDQRHFPEALIRSGTEKALPVFDDAERWLDVYFSGQIPDFTPALNPQGTAFRLAVWRALWDIPYGHTTSYGDVARALRLSPGAARAVGAAVGRNPISLIIPCHRVIGADGSLTGYAGGLERKAWLLRMERQRAAHG